MLPMALPENYFERHFPAWALAVSLVIHGAVIFFPRPEPPPAKPAAQRLEATLAQRPRVQPEQPPTPPPVRETRPRPAARPVTPPRPRMMLAERGKGPKVPATRKWSPAEKQEMDRFLEELAAQPRAAPRPTLAQRSLAMAREDARQQARREETGTALLERRPNSPPPDPFSLDHYVDGVIKRLNRSAAYVRNDPRAKGVRPAAVQFRLNPDGSLKSFTVLNAGDQQEEIAFVKSVVERAIPFAPFPPDIDRAARSLGVTICIQPGSGSGSGFGFTRLPDGRGC